MTLNADEDHPAPKIPISTFRNAVNHLHRQGGFTADMLHDEPIRGLVDATVNSLTDAVNFGLADNVIPVEMAEKLDRDVFVFSGCKTYQQLREASQLLRDEQGQIKPFHKFYEEVKSLHPNYNKLYLEAEHGFAVHSAQSAAQWAEIEHDGDAYDLQYRTANDGKVRPEHATLEGITLPPSDPFWLQYMTPNGWRCRCRVVQVRIGKTPRSDSNAAQQLGREATTQNDSQGRNRAEIFRFNPGKEQVVFPRHHPYYNLSAEARGVIEKMQPVKEILTKRDLELEFEGLDKKTNWFAKGFLGLYKEYNKDANGSTDCGGNIMLKDSIMKNCISAINKLKHGENIKESEALSVATLWHEITHNRNTNHGSMVLSSRERSAMECANEFIARKTLPEFYEAFGSKVQHPKFMDNRDNTGYNGMVCTYSDLIKLSGADSNAVVTTLKEQSFKTQLKEQEQCLRDAIIKHATITKKDGSALSEKDVNVLVASVVTVGGYNSLKSRFDNIISQR